MNGLLDHDRIIALAYAKSRFRSSFEALLMLDATLGNAVRAARDPLLGQIRLAWWRDELERVPTLLTTADPVLRAIRAIIARHDVIQGMCLAMVNGWEILLSDWPPEDDRLTEFGKLRGGNLFAAAGVLTGAGTAEVLVASGSAWALRDLSFHCSDKEVAKRASELATQKSNSTRRFPLEMRPFHILARLAEQDSLVPRGRSKVGSPFRVLQALGIVFLRR